jgi:hypothetical protein
MENKNEAAGDRSRMQVMGNRLWVIGQGLESFYEKQGIGNRLRVIAQGKGRFLYV